MTVAEAIMGKSKSKVDCRHESTKVIMKMNKQIKKNDKKTAKAIKKHDKDMKHKYEKLLKESKKLCSKNGNSDSSDSSDSSDISDSSISSDSDSSDSSDSSVSDRKHTRRKNKKNGRNRTATATKNVKVYFTVERISSKRKVQPSSESYSGQSYLKNRATQLTTFLRPYVQSVYSGQVNLTSKEVVYTAKVMGSTSDIRRAIKSFPLSNSIGGMYRFTRIEERIS